MKLSLQAFTALWFGILCSISPCPLATNIAAISFVSYRVSNRPTVVLSGILYTMGRSIVYMGIGYLILSSLVNVPLLADFLQRYINQFLGFLLIAVGFFLLDLVKMNLPSLSPPLSVQEKLSRSGIIGSFLLGGMFALAFCPVSAALFFGGLIPLAIQAGSDVGFPFLFGIGTAVPVLVFAALIALGSQYFEKLYHGLSRLEVYARKVTGGIFILIGIYYVYVFVLETL